MMHTRLLPLFALLSAFFATAATANSTPDDSCLVIAHRGASGYLPEHTLPAYRLGIRLGADYIEPDLVMTRDGVLVARHERNLGTSTNVSALPRFAGKRVRRTIPGPDGPQETDDWFIEDFSLAELRALRARETRPEVRPDNTAFDDLFPVPTLTEIIALLAAERSRTGKAIGLYPELKEPAFFRSRNLDPEGTLLAALRTAGLDTAGAPVFLQSFEADSLQRLRPRTKLPLVMLVEGAPAGEPSLPLPDFAAIASYADVIGAPKSLIMDTPGFMSGARAAGLAVHGWTFRVENAYLAVPFRRGEERTAPGDLAGEIEAALDAGMTGFFTDQPDVGRAVCDRRASPARGEITNRAAGPAQ